MQDYSKLFPKSYLGPRRKLTLIRRILRSNISQTLMLAAITLIVESSGRK